MRPFKTNELKVLADVYLYSLLLDLPSEAEIASQQVLSERFLNKMSLLVRKNHKKPQNWKRILLIAAIISTILLASASIYAHREVIVNFDTHVYKEFTTIVFPQTQEPSAPTNSSNTGWLPKDIPHR
ncbi:MAG: hypothetical protein GX749_09220 [Ruminococcaceae bacterium]|nr:hypothetical protein [Oscillospiraceae bacterium]